MAIKKEAQSKPPIKPPKVNREKLSSSVTSLPPKQRTILLIRGVHAEAGRPVIKGAKKDAQFRSLYQGYISLQISALIGEYLRKRDPENVSRAARREFAAWEITSARGAERLLKHFNNSQLAELGDAYYQACSAVQNKQHNVQADPRAAYAAATFFLDNDVIEFISESPLDSEEYIALFDLGWQAAIIQKKYDKNTYIKSVKEAAEAIPVQD